MKRILHLGLGRFHRGHQAMVYQRSGGWTVTASTMRSVDEKEKLLAVNLRYPVLELSRDEEKLTWVDCIGEALSLHHDLPRLLEVFSSPETEIVSLTVTEKGYCLNTQGELDLSHPGIQHDLETPHYPHTAIGFLAWGLRQRRHPLTILSCDNLRGNGHKLEGAVFKLLHAQKIDISVMKRLVSFPNTMVDRIVPALLPQKIVELEARHGLGKSELIATERFTQWVIEDRFMGPRPEWVGVEFVPDVTPFEEMKLRLLNASHSYLAYAGINRGYQFVHEAVRDEELRKDILTLMKEEVIPLLSIPEGFDPEAYADRLVERFQNDRLPHQLKQIAMDGSQKLPQRILSSLAVKGKHQTILRKAIDEWLDFLWNSREGKIDDPKAKELLSEMNLGKEVWAKNLKRSLGL